MDKKDIYVVGYPRSGSTWTSRLLGDLLNSPVTGLGDAHPLAEEGLQRTGPYVVRQLHLQISLDASYDTLVPNPHTLAVRRWKPGDLIVFVYRDPRDVAVSAWKYWDIDSLAKTIQRMGGTQDPLVPFGTWQKFMSDWLSAPILCGTVRYETLLHVPMWSLCHLLSGLNIPIPDEPRIQATIDRQNIMEKRKQIAASPEDEYMYGHEIQLKHLRKGIAGDWKNWFTQREGELAEAYFGELMRWLKYTESDHWWKGLRE